MQNRKQFAVAGTSHGGGPVTREDVGEQSQISKGLLLNLRLNLREKIAFQKTIMNELESIKLQARGSFWR